MYITCCFKTPPHEGHGLFSGKMSYKPSFSFLLFICCVRFTFFSTKRLPQREWVSSFLTAHQHIIGSPSRQLEETTRASSYHVAEHCPVWSKSLQPYTERSSRPGPEPSSTEADGYVWCYALLVVEEEEIQSWVTGLGRTCRKRPIFVLSGTQLLNSCLCSCHTVGTILNVIWKFHSIAVLFSTVTVSRWTWSSAFSIINDMQRLHLVAQSPHTTPQPFYGPFSGTTQVSRCQDSTSGLYGARED